MLHHFSIFNLLFDSLQNGEQDENIRQAQSAVRFAWLYIFMPLLFCLIGTGIDFSTETSSTISDACALVFSGALFLAYDNKSNRDDTCYTTEHQ